MECYDEGDEINLFNSKALSIAQKEGIDMYWMQ